MCLITIGDTQESIDRLVHAFEVLAAERPIHLNGNGAIGAHLRSSSAAIAPGTPAMSPRDAFYAPSRAIPLAQSVGEIAAELVIPYPPGIPVLAPGDVITAEKVEFLSFGAARGMYISGAADPRLETIKVVAEM
jgi:lysine decarboxylase